MMPAYDPYYAASQCNAVSALRELARVEAAQDPEVAGIVLHWYADGTVDVQLLNGQAMPIGGYSL